MAEHQGLPVAGYRPQSDLAVNVVNEHKRLEEELLRRLDGLANTDWAPFADPRWLSIARTHFEQGLMALNRAVFRPQRVKLPEDSA